MPSSAVLKMGTSTRIITSKHEIPWTDEEPQTNAKNAHVCATRSCLLLRFEQMGARGPRPRDPAARLPDDRFHNLVDESVIDGSPKQLTRRS